MVILQGAVRSRRSTSVLPPSPPGEGRGEGPRTSQLMTAIRWSRDPPTPSTRPMRKPIRILALPPQRGPPRLDPDDHDDVGGEDGDHRPDHAQGRRVADGLGRPARVQPGPAP